jgi:single-stranded DNA-binding protein
MAAKEFKGAGGFVQFPVEERDVNGQTVRDVTIRALGSDGAYIRITVWEEWADLDIDEGDLVFIDGPFEAREGQTREGEKRVYLNMSTSKSLKVFKSDTPSSTGVTKKESTSKAKAF